jgi:2-(1,2-epoxy-1,2-dihydrophenyl)acetyl-CoA isomerase
MTEPVLIEKVEGSIARLTMNRPDALNALSDELFHAVQEAYERLDRHNDVRVIVLTGRGRAFCAGGDINEMRGNSTELTFEQRVANLQQQASAIEAIDSCSKLTIAMVNGIAFGAGLSLALACDFRIAARSAAFIAGYIRMAFSGDCGGIHLLTNIVGAAKAKEMFFLSDPVNAENAQQIGLVTRWFEDEDLEAETLAFARRLAGGPGVAQLYMKMNFRQAHRPPAEAIATESVYMIRTAFTEDHTEAKKAFRGKRSPMFKGR